MSSHSGRSKEGLWGQFHKDTGKWHHSRWGYSTDHHVASWCVYLRCCCFLLTVSILEEGEAWLQFSCGSIQWSNERIKNWEGFASPNGSNTWHWVLAGIKRKDAWHLSRNTVFYCSLCPLSPSSFSFLLFIWFLSHDIQPFLLTITIRYTLHSQGSYFSSFFTQWLWILCRWWEGKCELFSSFLCPCHVAESSPVSHRTLVNVFETKDVTVRLATAARWTSEVF